MAKNMADASYELPPAVSDPNQPSTLWNAAWNQGYNQYGSSGNPYSGITLGGYDLGAGYTQGQQAYQTNLGSNDDRGNPPPVLPAPPPGPSVEDALRDQQRAELESGHQGYMSSLDKMLGQLPTEQAAQEGIVGSQYTQGVADLGAEQTTGLADLGQQRTRTEGNQTKNLADLSENIRNMFTSGQVKLGGMGAGDSSAVNQYSYALSKLGSKARGDQMGKTADIMSEIDNREFKLNTISSNEKTRLGSERDKKMLQITQWFSEATRELQGLKGQALREKGQNLAGLTQNALDYAMQQAQQAQAIWQNKQTALDQWAINQATSIGEVRKNLQSVASYQSNLPGTPYVNAQLSQGNTGSFGAPTGFGYSTEEDK